MAMQEETEYGDLISRSKAIEIMQRMKKKKEECNCRHGSYEAEALGYAIETIKQLPAYDEVKQ
jgi:hypothetical protein